MGFGRKIDDTTLAGLNKRGYVKGGSTVTSAAGYTPVPIIEGIPYYKNDNTTYSAFTGTTGSAAGTAGLVPAPATTDKDKFLSASGSWATIPKYSNVVGATSTTAGSDGLVPGAAAGEQDYFLTGDGKWTKVTIDTALSSDSTNAVQNKVVNTALSGKVSTATTINGKALSSNITLSASDVSAIATSAKGAAGGVAELGSDGKVPSSQLPSYVDDVIEGTLASETSFKVDGTAVTGETGKIYVDTTSNITYRWSGSKYTEISASLALGETSSTAYYGDKGKVAYDHSQATHAPTTDATQTARGIMSAADKKKLDGIDEGANKYVLPTATSSVLGGVKTGSTVTSASGYTPVPIIDGIPYYKNDNTTYTAADGIKLDSGVFKHTNSVTAGTASGSATATLDYSGTFDIPTITYDAYGHITGKGTTTLTLPAKVTNASTVNVATNSSTATYKLVGTDATGNTKTLTDSGVTVKGKNVTATTFTGALVGNADTATALTSSAGDTTTPVYFSNGKPVATTYYDPVKDVTVTIPTTDWTSASGTGYSYTKTIEVTDILATDIPTMSLKPASIVATEDEMDLYDLIVGVETLAGSIKVYVSAVPTESFNIVLHGVPNRSKVIPTTSAI